MRYTILIERGREITKMRILVIGDLHIQLKRIKAINTALNSIFNIIKNQKYDNCIFLGDITHKSPSIEERLVFCQLINSIKKYVKQFIIIKGTESHDFTKGIYNFEDLPLISNIKIKQKFKLNNYYFLHENIKGLKYSNGFTCEEGLNLKINSKERAVCGHFHSFQQIKNIITLGSIYKVSFSEIKDNKKIAIINNNNIEFINLDNRPMYMLYFNGEGNKLTIKGLDKIKHKEIDLKVTGITDIITLPKINKLIAKLQSKLNIEYYQEEIEIKESKIKIPKELNQLQLLEKYCKERKVDFEIVKKEIK